MNTMRIPGRPKRRKPFARGRAPPPQATKLLTASMSAGIVLIILLAVVFIPRALFYEGQPRPPRVDLQLDASDGFHVLVTDVSENRPLADWSATLWILPSTNDTISPLVHAATSGSLGFEDRDGSGTLSPGDAFPIEFQPSLSYRFTLVLLPLDRDIVVIHWTGGGPPLATFMGNSPIATASGP